MLALVRGLQQQQKYRRSVRTLLREFGYSNLELNDRNLRDMTNEEVTKKMTKWLLHYSEEGQSYEIRFKIEKHTVYVTHIAKRQRTWFARHTEERPELFGKALHCWQADATFSALPSAEVQRSVTRADAVNLLTEDELQEAIRWKK